MFGRRRRHGPRLRGRHERHGRRARSVPGAERLRERVGLRHCRHWKRGRVGCIERLQRIERVQRLRRLELGRTRHQLGREQRLQLRGSAREGQGDGGALWSPTTDAPIHFHWMIGGFTTADILPNQAGAVVYDIDGENSTAADVAAIHAAGAIAVCYVDVGTLEKGRSDYSQFPSSVVGPVVPGWPGENWLLVTRGQPEPSSCRS